MDPHPPAPHLRELKSKRIQRNPMKSNEIKQNPKGPVLTVLIAKMMISTQNNSSSNSSELLGELKHSTKYIHFRVLTLRESYKKNPCNHKKWNLVLWWTKSLSSFITMCNICTLLPHWKISHYLAPTIQRIFQYKCHACIVSQICNQFWKRAI